MESNIQSLLNALKESVFREAADTPPELRQAIQQKIQSEVNTGDSPPLRSAYMNAYVEKISRNAYKIVDQDLENLKAEAYSESEIFEITVAAGWSAGISRYERGLKLLKFPTLMRLEILENGNSIFQRLLFFLIKKDMGFLPGPIAMMSYKKKFFGKNYAHLIHAVLREAQHWSISDLEIMGSFLSDRNSCKMCLSDHKAVASQMIDPEVIEAVLENHSTASYF